MKTFALMHFICICTLSYGQNSDSLNRARIIGRWVSEDDKRDEVTFTKSHKFEYYDKKLESSERYRIQNDSLIAIDKLTGDYFIYSLEGVSEKYLSLMYLPSGRMLLFRREKAKQTN